MELTFASYNIHKGVGMDRRRDPERIMAVLHEIDADIIALQEADRRIGERPSVIQRRDIEDSHWHVAPVAKRARSIGWHGNAILVRKGLEIGACHALDLPTIEPRGAACAEVTVEGQRLRVIGTHLDLSGIKRRDQIRSLIDYVARCEGSAATVILGDFNQWGRTTGAMREFDGGWKMIAPGKSYPSNRPLAQLDRIVACDRWECADAGVHHTALSAVASDHLPIFARLRLVKK